MTASQRIGLGTAQFGMNYGVANRRGIASRGELASILEAATERGVRILDTAPGYGTSESLLGELLPKQHRFRIVTKTSVDSPIRSGDAAASFVARGLKESLGRLRVSSVYGLLEHDPDRLLGTRGDEVFGAMAALRDEGTVQRIGASVYSREQLDAIVARHAVDLVQIPISVFDQRFLCRGRLGALRAAGIEVHARSVLLQGVVGMTPDALPSFLSGLVSPLGHLTAFSAENGLTPVAAAVAFVLGQTDVDVVLCGVEDRVQLCEVLDVSQAEFDMNAEADLRTMSVTDPQLIDPSRWPEKT